MQAADLERSAAHYRRLAPRYDHFTRRINRIRERTIEALGLEPGQRVLDAGCGTGWCIPRLAQRVGPTGEVIAFDPSPDMLSIARRHTRDVATAVVLLRASAEDVVIPRPVDAILFSYTHDLIQSRPALENLLRQARPGARVAATSTKLFAPWLFPANWYLRRSHREYITNFDGFEAPWSLLQTYLEDFRVDTRAWSHHYVATGRIRAA